MADTGLFGTIYNPDVLTCLANLSNDEVFTPPDVANAMLDMLPQDLFKNPDIKFLDPACKSGVFLREIAKRLIKGLEPQIPDLQERLDHIFHNQIYGIAITEITSLLSRRSVYCTKYPNSEYSVSKFSTAEGQVRYRLINHTWKNGKCIYCGTSQEGQLSDENRSDGLETHAYEFIHTYKPEEILDMKFDVIISNPPYQLNTASDSAQAKPIYHKFVEQAMKLKPRYLSMIIPARWYAGGWGLDAFRDKMLSENKLSVIHDYPNTSDCFPGINIRGRVCYFLWDRDKKTQECEIYNYTNGKLLDVEKRPLLEKGEDTFFRYNKAISIYHKVMAFKEKPFIDMVSSQKPFGLATNYKGQENPDSYHSVKVYTSKQRISYATKSGIPKGLDLLPKYKLLMSKASPGADEIPHAILSKPIISEPNSVCTESYITIGPFDSEKECENVASYISTKFFRFLVMLKKPSMDTLRKVYQLVPMQDFSKPWTDEELYQKYGISQDEIEFIDSMIKPME